MHAQRLVCECSYKFYSCLPKAGNHPNWWLTKHILVFLCNGILLRIKKEQTYCVCNEMDQYKRHDTEWKKPDRKRVYTIWFYFDEARGKTDLIYDSRSMVAWGWGWEVEVEKEQKGTF